MRATLLALVLVTGCTTTLEGPGPWSDLAPGTYRLPPREGLTLLAVAAPPSDNQPDFSFRDPAHPEAEDWLLDVVHDLRASDLEPSRPVECFGRLLRGAPAGLVLDARGNAGPTPPFRLRFERAERRLVGEGLFRGTGRAAPSDAFPFELAQDAVVRLEVLGLDNAFVTLLDAQGRELVHQLVDNEFESNPLLVALAAGVYSIEARGPDVTKAYPAPCAVFVTAPLGALR